MSGWAIALLVGAAVLVLLVGLLVVVLRAAARTAASTQAVVDALEELRTKTLVLDDLDALGRTLSDTVTSATPDGREARTEGNGHEPDLR